MISDETRRSLGEPCAITLQVRSRHADWIVKRSNPWGNDVPTAEERLAILDEVLTEAAARACCSSTRTTARSTGARSRSTAARCVSFGSCSYLGLELDPRMRDAVIDAVMRYGTQFSLVARLPLLAAVHRARGAAERDVRRPRARHADDVARPPVDAAGARRLHATPCCSTTRSTPPCRWRPTSCA